VHPQLEEVTTEFRAAQTRLHNLVSSVPAARWHLRSDPARWSMAECVEHLNLTSQAFLPALRTALERGRAGSKDRGAHRRYRRDPIGWVLWRTAGPPVRHRVKTTSAFIPASARPLPELVAEFDRLQDDQIRCALKAEGLPLGRLRIRSPFNPRIRYNVYSCLTILPRHQHRHLWQAEQVAATLGATLD
jgi:hypothetical protein